MNNKYSLVIFDMDGTILNTLEDIADSLNSSLRELGYRERSYEEIRGFLGCGGRELVNRATDCRLEEEKIKEICRIFGPRYKENCHIKTRPYDGILNAIGELRREGYMTAVVSNKPNGAVRVLCEDMFRDCFDLYCGEQDGMRRKPAPDMVEYVISKLGVDKKKCLYVGDSEVDIETAKNTGIDCIAVSWGFRDRPVLEKLGAEPIVDNAKELLAAIIK